MKKIYTLTLFMLVTLNTQAYERSNYFRVWQGFENTQLAEGEFVNEWLPKLMQATIDYYSEEALNNYIVIVPPKKFPDSDKAKPDFIPDELALIGLSSKTDYDRLRQTPQGQSYMDMHGPVFEWGPSKSSRQVVVYDPQNPPELRNDWAYDMIGESVDWSEGYNTVFIGVKKESLSKAEFKTRLKSHIEMAQKLMPSEGLRGYMVIANEQYEVAYLNWESKDVHEAAVASNSGAQVFGDAGEIMDILVNQPAVVSDKVNEVQLGGAYSFYPPAQQ